MKFKTLLVAMAAVLGIGGSAAAYQMAASPASPVKPAANHGSAAKDEAAPAKVEVPKILPVTRFEWAPCEPPAELRGDECVTQVVQTVTLPSAPSGGGSSSGDDNHQGGGSGDDYDEPEASHDDDGDDDDDHEDDEGEDHEEEEHEDD